MPVSPCNVYSPFIVVEYDESDGNISGEPPPDYKYGTSKRDIHTINEQRRRDMIKVQYTCRKSVI